MLETRILPSPAKFDATSVEGASFSWGLDGRWMVRRGLEISIRLFGRILGRTHAAVDARREHCRCTA